MGYFVGIEHNVGNAMTFRILTHDTRQFIARSGVRPADDPSDPNLRVDPHFPEAFPTAADVLADAISSRLRSASRNAPLGLSHGEPSDGEASASTHGEVPPPAVPDPLDPALLRGEDSVPHLRSRADVVRHHADSVVPTPDLDAKQFAVPIVDPTTLIGRTFLHKSDVEDGQVEGQVFRSKIIAVVDADEAFEKHPNRIKFRCSINNGKY